MQSIKIKPAKIIGICPAGLMMDSEFSIMGMNLENEAAHPICFLALSHFPTSVWQLQANDRFLRMSLAPAVLLNWMTKIALCFCLATKIDGR